MVSGVVRMYFGSKISAFAVASAMCCALAAPATAHTDMEPKGYEAAITDAKRAMVANPTQALDLARNAKAIAAATGEPANKANLVANWLEGEALMRLNRSQEAAGVIGFALFEASQKHKDDKVYADLLRASASLKARGGDPREALAHFAMAQARYKDLGDLRSQAIVLQNIGSLYSRANNFDAMLKHYQQASEIYPDDAVLMLSNHNNIGFAQMKMGQYAEAEQSFAKALTIAEDMDSAHLKARILTNLAATRNHAGKTDIADANAKEALALAGDGAPQWVVFIYGVQAQIELSKGNLEQAEAMIAKAFEGQELTKTNPLFRDFHETANQILAQRGKQELATLHKDARDRLDSTARGLKI